MPARLFVALDVPEAVADVLTALHTPDLAARWTPSDQYHLTLRFLGDVEEARIDALDAALGGVRAEGLKLAGAGLDVFPSRRRPRVLVFRLAPQPALLRLQGAVEAAVAACGVRPDAKPFAPHLTLARLKGASPQDVRGYLRRHEGATLPRFEATAFHLYESVLRPKGALHTRIATYALG